MKLKQTLKIGVLLTLVSVLGVVFLQRQTIVDWFKLRGYQPPAVIASLATDDTMTPSARHLFYVNRPDITTGSNFTTKCPSGGEKTVVLGCYLGNDAGIYLYDVTDTRLQGVEQVTAAHEMLHAAYNRLGPKERQEVDGWLTNYYETQLTDERIKATIEAYKQSEPNDVVNEMHSIFGTEITTLPAPLEQYYRRYFVDRSKVAGYTATYQAEFTNRRQQISDYDEQLKGLKATIETNQTEITKQKNALDTRSQQMERDRASGNIAAYNAAVSPYNAAVASYNSLVVTTKGLIDTYNDIVTKRNAVALEERELVQALSSGSLTTQ